MSSELAKDAFKQSIKDVANLHGGDISDEFVDSVLDGKIEILISDNIFDVRLQTRSENRETIIFVPEMYNTKVSDDKSTTLWNLMIDAVINLRGLSGPGMYQLSELKIKHDA